MNNAEILMRACDGINVLRERQKAVTKEHSERIKRLQALVADVTHAAKSRGNDLFGGTQLSLSPDTEALLENPVANL